jgi:peptidoglycan/xylan/chitin deacetylase (PgdA/CDA1 family)
MSEPLLILTYHSIDESGSVLSTDPAVFERQMAALAQAGYRGAGLAEVVDHANRFGSWPARTVAITFDDGYRNNLSIAQPLLAKHGFTASLYLVTSYVGGVNDWEPPLAKLGERAIVSWQDVGALAEQGWDIGVHTRTHPRLAAISDLEAADEILGARDDIARELGQPAVTFAYPGGQVSAPAKALVEEHFVAGCTTVLRRAKATMPRHLLPRIEMFYFRDLGRFERLLAGGLGAYLAIRRCGRFVRGAVSRS